MIDANAALQRLKQGNEQFCKHIGKERTFAVPPLPSSAGQQPFAVILGCADSRVPPELIFTQDAGELFVVRVAGNIATPSQMGSIEFAAEKFGTPLVVVLGHSHCGAVAATIEAMAAADAPQSSPAPSPNLVSLVTAIQPGIAGCLDGNDDPAEQMQKAVRANVRHAMKSLESESEVLRGKVAAKELHITGAEYCLDTGRVEFL